MGCGCFAMVAAAGEKRDRDRGAASLPSQCHPLRAATFSPVRGTPGSGRGAGRGRGAARAAPGAATGRCRRPSPARGGRSLGRGAASPRTSAVVRPFPPAPAPWPGPAPPRPAEVTHRARRFRRAGGARGAALAARPLARPVSAGPGFAGPGRAAAGPAGGMRGRFSVPGAELGAPPRQKPQPEAPGLRAAVRGPLLARRRPDFPRSASPPRGSRAALTRVGGALAVRDRRGAGLARIPKEWSRGDLNAPVPRCPSPEVPWNT